MIKNAFMISAMKSGRGKTLITLALADIFKKSGKRISMFKTGPDYIDTMYHSKITNAPSTNLDPFFLEPDFKPGELKKLFHEHMKGDIGIIEGAMGLFDGVYGEGKRGSACTVSDKLNIDVILVLEEDELDSLGEYLSRYDNRVRAVILNRLNKDCNISILKDKIKASGLRLLGYLYENNSFHIKSRHLGLFEPREDIYNIIEAVSNELLKSLDREFISEFKTEVHLDKPPEKSEKKYRIAYAFDEAFSFTYNTNIEVLKKFGFEIIKFSPLYDKALPQNVDVVWLSGGYPENYARELSENSEMSESIKASGAVIIGECGGFIYLHESFTDVSGNYYPGVGLIQGRAFKTEKLVRFGYIDIEAKKDGILFKKNQRIRSHEFHYYDSTNNGDSCYAIKANKSRGWDCIHSNGRIFAGFPHLYLRGYEFMIENLIDFLEEKKVKNV